MAEHYFPEVAEWFAGHGPEGALHMLMGRIKALEDRVEGMHRPENEPTPPAEQPPPAVPEGMPNPS